MNVSPELFKKKIKTALEYSSKGKNIKAKTALYEIYSIIIVQPFVIWDEPVTFELGKAFLYMYYADMFEQEKKNMQIAHFSFLYLTQALKHAGEIGESDEADNRNFEILKNILILLHISGDCFTRSLTVLYYLKNTTSTPDDCKQLALKIFTYIQLEVLNTLKDVDPSLRNESFLHDIASYLDRNQTIITQNISNEAKNMRNLLFEFTLRKIRKNDFLF